MLTALGWRRVRMPLRLTGSPSAPGNTQRAYASKRRPKSLAESHVSDSNWMAYMPGAVAMQDTLPKTDKKPLPKLFNAEGLLPPPESKPIALPASAKSRTKKAKKSKSVARKKLAKRVTPQDEAMARWEQRELEEFTGPRTDHTPKEYAEANSRTHQAIDNQERLVKDRKAKKVLPSFMRETPDNLVGVDTENELVQDPKLIANWKKTVDKKIMLLKTRKALKSTASAKSASSSKKAKKVRTDTSEKSASPAKAPQTTQKIEKNATNSKRVLSETDSIKSSTTSSDKVGSKVSSNKMEEMPLTFLEGSEEDLANFALEIEEVPGELAVKNRLARPHLRKKVMQIPTRFHDKSPDEPIDEKTYMEGVQKQDDLAAKQYVDQYDSDLVSTPPKPLKTLAAKFADKLGANDAKVDTMGTALSLKVRGIRFDGFDTHDWTVRDPLISQDVADTKFKFHMPVEGLKLDDSGSTGFGWAGRIPVLDGFSLEFDIPTKLATTQSDPSSPLLEDASIHVKTSHTKDVSSFAIHLVLPDGSTIHPTSLSIDERGNPATFDEQIKQIQLQLPAKTYLKSCWNCALSQYSPMEKPVFGRLACFRNWPNIATVRDKMELLRNWSKHVELIQETHSCESFQRRTRPRIEGFNTPKPKNPEGIKRRKVIEGEKNKKQD